MVGVIYVGFCPKCNTRCSVSIVDINISYITFRCVNCSNRQTNKQAKNISVDNDIAINYSNYIFELDKLKQKKTYCFDLDNTLCSQEYNYSEAKPFLQRIKKVNELYDKGHPIIILTARGMGTGENWEQKTKIQLDKWGLKYDSLHLTKPPADVYIDDKGITDTSFFNIFNNI